MKKLIIPFIMFLLISHSTRQGLEVLETLYILTKKSAYALFLLVFTLFISPNIPFVAKYAPKTNNIVRKNSTTT